MDVAREIRFGPFLSNVGGDTARFLTCQTQPAISKTNKDDAGKVPLVVDRVHSLANPDEQVRTSQG